MIMDLLHTASLVVDTANDLPNPVPDWGFVGTNAAKAVYNGGWALLLILGGIGVLVAGGFLIFGKVAHHGDAFKIGLITLGCAVAGLAVGAGAGAIVGFGANLQL